MKFHDIRDRLEDRFCAIHVSSGRVFIYVPAHAVDSEVLNGGGKPFVVAESLYEIVNDILVPFAIPYAMLEDEFRLASSETQLPHVFSDIASLMDAALTENRIGRLVVPATMVSTFEAIARGAKDFDIVSTLASDIQSEYTLVCVDFEPIKDGQKTPLYNMHYDEVTREISWVLDKRYEM